MIQPIRLRLGGHRHTNAARDQGQHVRGSLQKLLRAGYPGKAILYLVSPLLGQGHRLCIAVQLLYVQAEGARRGAAAA